MLGGKIEAGRRHAIERRVPKQEFNNRGQRVTSHRRFNELLSDRKLNSTHTAPEGYGLH